MPKIAIVTDSTAYIPKGLSKGYDIHIVPSTVIWGDETFRDGVDIQPDEFYKRLASSKVNPTTSQPSPGDFEKKYNELAKQGFTDILGVYVSRHLSGTISSAETAKQMVSGINIAVVDAKSASMGTGWPLLEGAKAAKAGKSLDECVKIVEHARDNSSLLIMVDTLEFLHRGGRIGGAARFLGTALNLKPILEVIDGKLEATERVRTKSKALDRICELMVERIGGRKPVRLGVLHAAAEADAKALLEQASKLMNPIESTLCDVSPAVGTHTGPGTLGLAVMAGID